MIFLPNFRCCYWNNRNNLSIYIYLFIHETFFKHYISINLTNSKTKLLFFTWITAFMIIKDEIKKKWNKIMDSGNEIIIFCERTWTLFPNFVKKKKKIQVSTVKQKGAFSGNFYFINVSWGLMLSSLAERWR